MWPTQGTPDQSGPRSELHAAQLQGCSAKEERERNNVTMPVMEARNSTSEGACSTPLPSDDAVRSLTLLETEVARALGQLWAG